MKIVVLINMSKGAIQFNEQNFECYTPKYIVDMFDQIDLFNVESYKVGKVKVDVKPYKIIEDYMEYFDEK